MPRFTRSAVLAISLAVCFVPSLLRAQPVLPGLFSNHMVLQREHDIQIWGWADRAEAISVSIAGNTRNTVAGKDGRWKVILPKMKAGGPFLLKVRGKNDLTIKDVMVGEVWVLSGQSNMTFALSGADNATAELPVANYPEIRLFTVPEKNVLVPQTNVAAVWETCTPETAKSFSAVAYFFGKELYKQLGVPVGLIHTSWPGTSAEDWATPNSLRGDPELAPILQRWESSAESRELAAQPTGIDLEFDDFELVKQANGTVEATRFANFDQGDTKTSLDSLWTYHWQSAPDTAFELVSPGYGGSGFAARISGQIDFQDSAVLEASYSASGAPADLSIYAGIRFRYRGKGSFRTRSVQPTIYDYDDYATSDLTASTDWQSATIWFKDLKQAGWGVPEAFTANSLSGFIIEALRSPGDFVFPPSGLFNGMIAPLIPFAIRGAAWYQGEGNAPRAYQYRRLLPALIRGWRGAWGEGGFPFLVVQLPNYGDPVETVWSEMRESQLMVLQQPNTGLAVTIDVGESNNLHPHRKAEVGRRLALWALGTTYGKDLVYSGPLYKTMEVEGKSIRLHFNHVGRGLQAHGEILKGFKIAGTDRNFLSAEARIEKDTIVVSSPEVPAPVAVRYAWAGSPDCNLYNQERLPASPFRTDDWPISTINLK